MQRPGTRYQILKEMPDVMKSKVLETNELTNKKLAVKVIQ